MGFLKVFHIWFLVNFQHPRRQSLNRHWSVLLDSTSASTSKFPVMGIPADKMARGSGGGGGQLFEGKTII